MNHERRILSSKNREDHYMSLLKTDSLAPACSDFLSSLFQIKDYFQLLFFLRTSEINLFYNLQVFYWHFLEILWLFIFLVLYLWFLKDRVIIQRFLFSLMLAVISLSISLLHDYSLECFFLYSLIC